MAQLVAVGLLLFFGWRISLEFHPRRKCPTCKGSGQHHGAIYTKAFRACTRCAGNGWVLRTGARHS
jgi:DnaJ-class molecular chaperone